MINKFNLFLLTGFGSGLSKISPGTCGTLSFVLLYWLGSQLAYPTLTVRILLAVFLTGLSFLLTRFYFRQRLAAGGEDAAKDPQFIVLDEWAGMAVTLLPVSSDYWLHLLLAFGLFRFFDITKLSIIGQVDRLEQHPAFALVFDDVLAGVAAALTLFALLALLF